MKNFRTRWVITALLIAQLSFSQTYIVKTKTLNVREETNKYSKIIGQLYENDTVTAILTDGNWIKVKISENEGFVNKNYVKSNTQNETDVENESEFVFSKFFYSSSIIVFVILSTYRRTKSRIKDGRRSKGYREYSSSFKEYIVDAIYAAIIGLFISLIVGIIYWIKTF